MQSLYDFSSIRVGIVGYRDVTLTPRFEYFPLTRLDGGGDAKAREFIEKKIVFRTGAPGCETDRAEVRPDHAASARRFDACVDTWRHAGLFVQITGGWGAHELYAAGRMS